MTSKMESDVQRVRQNYRSLICRKFRPRPLSLINFYTVFRGKNKTDNVERSIFFAEMKGCFRKEIAGI